MSKPQKKPTGYEEFPWLRCRPGDSFFVPSLDPYRTVQQGMRQAANIYGVKMTVKPRYKVGIYKGLLGVLFTAPR